MMNQSDEFRENAANCAELAETASEQPTQLRYRRMQASWLVLAKEQDWLEGRVAETTSSAN
jgi:hypothetical protein